MGTYAETINVSWDPASDANNNSLLYTIDLLNSDLSYNKTIISNISGITTTFDSTTVLDGEYFLKGTICDNGSPILCSEFLTNYSFLIDNTQDIGSLSSISIQNNGILQNYAKTGDTVSLTFNSSINLVNPSVVMYSGGNNLIGTVSIEEIDVNIWRASVVINSSDTDGYLSFAITAENLDSLYEATSDNSYVFIDNTAPVIPSSNYQSGDYNNQINVELYSESADEIIFTTNGDTPTCTSGEIFTTAIPILNSSTIHAIACDLINNPSTVVTFIYNISNSSSLPTPEYTNTSNNYSLITTILSNNKASSTKKIANIELNRYDDYPEFINIPGEENSINLTDGQVITENPYILKTNVIAKNGINKVEFCIDENLVCTQTEKSDEGLYTCSWNTSKYHSIVKVIAYSNEGKTNFLTRTVQVKLDDGNKVENAINNCIYLLLLIIVIILGVVTFKKLRHN